MLSELTMAYEHILLYCFFFRRNFGLLSFGAEAEEDEEETDNFVQKYSGKAKSTHDVLDDPNLSKETAVLIKIGKMNIFGFDLHNEYTVVFDCGCRER